MKQHFRDDPPEGFAAVVVCWDRIGCKLERIIAEDTPSRVSRNLGNAPSRKCV